MASPQEQTRGHGTQWCLRGIRGLATSPGPKAGKWQRGEEKGVSSQVGVGPPPDPASPGQQGQLLLVYVLPWAYETEIKAQPASVIKDL